MAETQRIKIGAGDTEPLTIVIEAADENGDPIDNLDDLTTAKLYLREVANGARIGSFSTATNHVNGVTSDVLVSDNMTVTFDPVGNGPASGNAFATASKTYDGYLKLTWDDADLTRHPAAVEDFLRVVVGPSLE